jgi:osmotically-inducible protein OsmY
MATLAGQQSCLSLTNSHCAIDEGHRTDAAVAERVRSALHRDPFFLDTHVDVSARNGVVTLSGFVFSDWDLMDAIRIANVAARPNRVIDNLQIEIGGRN